VEDFRSIELFAGCGGLALGIAQAGFSHVLVVENDARACATITANKKRRIKHFADWTVEHADVRDIDFTKWAGSIDLVSGGPPCQPFSIGGNHKGPTDSRNMWPQALRAVEEIRPKAFIFENVRGLLRPAFAEYLEYLRLQLTWPEIHSRTRDWKHNLKLLRQHEKVATKPEYHVVVRGVNAADYGAAQKRHRAIFMGIRSDVVTETIFPKPTHSMEALVRDQRINGGYWKRHGIARRQPVDNSEAAKKAFLKLKSGAVAPQEAPWKTVRDTIGDLPRPYLKSESLTNHRLHPGARVYVGHTGSSWDEPAKALKAGAHGVPGGENVIVSGDGRVRYFTIREMARLQGMPDTFSIEETWQSSIKQLGNAVPVEIGRVFGNAIREQIVQP
jgi:DNA (cytosine-5)-methyltransferase 1